MSASNIRSHAAHASRNKKEDSLGELPSQLLKAESPQVNALLERLDDVIFPAVLGNRSAMEEARKLWPQVIQAIGWELVEESREQYLRYAIDAARMGEQQEIRKPENSIAALEVILLLTRN